MSTAHAWPAKRGPALASPWPQPVNAAQAGNTRQMAARGPDGELRYFLQRSYGGLYVEREEIPRHGIPTSQSLHFRERSGFERWCADDPARFSHPLLLAQLKRDADALWLSSA